jgi:hypothetical protein
MNMAGPYEKLIEYAEHIAECEEWMEKCPAWKADGLQETLWSYYEKYSIFDGVRKCAIEVGDEALLETVLGALDESEYGDLDSHAFWREVASMTKILRKAAK